MNLNLLPALALLLVTAVGHAGPWNPPNSHCSMDEVVPLGTIVLTTYRAKSTASTTKVYAPKGADIKVTLMVPENTIDCSVSYEAFSNFLEEPTPTSDTSRL